MSYTAPATWGELAQPGGDQVPDGLYGAIIESEEVVLDARGVAKKTEDGKFRVKITVKLRRPDHSVATLTRTMPVSFGKNMQSGTYSRFSSYLEVIHGVPCGDPRQQQIPPGSGQRKTCRVVVKNENGYSNIVDFLKIDKSPLAAAPQPSQPAQPQSQWQQAAQQQPAPQQESYDDSEIPF